MAQQITIPGGDSQWAPLSTFHLLVIHHTSLALLCSHFLGGRALLLLLGAEFTSCQRQDVDDDYLLSESLQYEQKNAHTFQVIAGGREVPHCKSCGQEWAWARGIWWHRRFDPLMNMVYFTALIIEWFDRVQSLPYAITMPTQGMNTSNFGAPLPPPPPKFLLARCPAAVPRPFWSRHSASSWGRHERAGAWTCGCQRWKCILTGGQVMACQL